VGLESDKHGQFVPQLKFGFISVLMSVDDENGYSWQTGILPDTLVHGQGTAMHSAACIVKPVEPHSKVRMVDDMRGGSRRISNGNPAVAQGANDEPFQNSSGNQVLKWLEVPTKQMRWRLIRQIVTACFATPPGGLLKEAQ
jgi:O-glycosyl hydrolase